MSKLVCVKCGSPYVRQKYWKDINTGDFECVEEDYWCCDCEDYTDVCREEEYPKMRFELDLDLYKSNYGSHISSYAEMYNEVVERDKTQIRIPKHIESIYDIMLAFGYMRKVENWDFADAPTNEFDYIWDECFAIMKEYVGEDNAEEYIRTMEKDFKENVFPDAAPSIDGIKNAIRDFMKGCDSLGFSSFRKITELQNAVREATKSDGICKVDIL